MLSSIRQQTFSEKPTFLTLDTTCAYQREGNVSFSESFCCQISENIEVTGNMGTKWVTALSFHASKN